MTRDATHAEHSRAVERAQAPHTRSQREPYAAEMRREAPSTDSPAVRVKHDAYCLMGDAVFGQSVEVGGGLFGWSARKPGGGITVVEANLACSDVTANGLNLDFDQLLAVSDGWAHHGGAVRLIGDWHSHPDRSATPSRKDVKAWVAAFDMVAAEHRSVSHYFGLIVGPAGRDDAGNCSTQSYPPGRSAATSTVARSASGHAWSGRDGARRVTLVVDRAIAYGGTRGEGVSS
jgi:hypothetical protein